MRVTRAFARTGRIAAAESDGLKTVCLRQYGRGNASSKDAQRRFLEGENRQTVESWREAVAAVAGKSPTDEDEAQDVISAIKAAKASTQSTKLGYATRYELVRQSLKFLSDWVHTVTSARPRVPKLARP